MGYSHFHFFDIIKFLVKNEEVNVDEIVVNSSYCYPFLMATEVGNVELLKFLRAHGANVNDWKGEKALEVAVDALSIAAKDQAFQTKTLPKDRALQMTETIFYLIRECQVNVNSSQQLVQVACQSGSLELVQLLIEKHKMDCCSNMVANTYTPLMAAAQYGHLPIVNYLLENGSLESIFVRYDQKTARDYAKENDHQEIAKILKNHEEKKSKIGRVKHLARLFSSWTSKKPH